MNLSSKPSSFFKPWQLTLLMVLFFCLAMGIRLYDLTDLPSEFYMVRQYRGLVIARGMYYAGLDAAEDWQRDFAVSEWKSEGLIEPPILEGMIAMTYRVIGERIWVGRIYSSLFWLAGALALWFLAKDLGMKHGGLLAVGYFLFHPFGIIASRTIMPDPLMVSLMVWSIWALHRWEMKPTWKNTILAGILTGIAIFVKSVVVFPLLCAAAALVISRLSLKRIFLSGKTWAVIGITVLPTAIFYIYGLFVEGSLGGQFSLRFFPEMLVDRSFYARWLFLMAGITGLLALFFSWTGILLFQTRFTRYMVIGLWIGYVIFGLFFPYHFLTHEYYHLPILPIVAIGLIPAAEAFFEQLKRIRTSDESAQPSCWHRVVVTALIILAVAMNMWDARNTLARDNFRPEVAYWTELGQVIGHDQKIIQLSGDYGSRLAFFGWVKGRTWPMVADMKLRELAGQESDQFSYMFSNMTAGMDLFVITSLPEFEDQPELKQYLESHYPITSEGDGYLIYNLRP